MSHAKTPPLLRGRGRLPCPVCGCPYGPVAHRLGTGPAAHSAALIGHQDQVRQLDARGRLVVDTDGWRVTWDGYELPLTRQTFVLLRQLVDHPGQAFTRDQLLEACWPLRLALAPQTVDVHVRWLRAALAPVVGARVATVYGVGYRWDWDPAATMRDVFPRDRVSSSAVPAPGDRAPSARRSRSWGPSARRLAGS